MLLSRAARQRLRAQAAEHNSQDCALQHGHSGVALPHRAHWRPLPCCCCRAGVARSGCRSTAPWVPLSPPRPSSLSGPSCHGGNSEVRQAVEQHPLRVVGPVSYKQPSSPQASPRPHHLHKHMRTPHARLFNSRRHAHTPVRHSPRPGRQQSCLVANTWGVPALAFDSPCALGGLRPSHTAGLLLHLQRGGWASTAWWAGRTRLVKRCKGQPSEHRRSARWGRQKAHHAMMQTGTAGSRRSAA